MIEQVQVAMRPYVFSSNAPIVLDWWNESQAAIAHHQETLNSVAPEVAPWPGAKPAVIGAFGRWRFEGFIADRDPPDGWRRYGRAGQWIRPKKSTTQGKKLIARMAEVPPLEDPRVIGGIPGVATDVFGPRPALCVIDTVAWIEWPKDWDRPDTVDPAIWTRRRMSEFYIAKEAAADNPAEADPS